jgi:hypothetical protein
MHGAIIRPAFVSWPEYNGRLRDAVSVLTEEQLAFAPGPDRWPIWASIGHVACQRVFWLCDFAGAPGAERTPFTNAASNCPGDDDLEHVLSADQLVAALDSTFGVVERCLDTWTIDQLPEEIRRLEWGPGRVHTRGWIIQRVFAHDVWHIAEVNEALTRMGIPPIDLWG